MANVVKRSVSFAADTWELIEEEVARTGRPASTIIDDLVKHRLALAAWVRAVEAEGHVFTAEGLAEADRILAESEARRAAWAATPTTPEP